MIQVELTRGFPTGQMNHQPTVSCLFYHSFSSSAITFHHLYKYLASPKTNVSLQGRPCVPVIPSHSICHPLLKQSSTGLKMTGLRKSFFLPRLTKTKRSQVFLGQSGGKTCLGCSRFLSGKIGSKLTKFDCCPAVNSGLRSCNLPSSARIK